MDAEDKLIQTQTTYITALYSYNTSKASLDQAMGLKVELDVANYYKEKISHISTMDDIRRLDALGLPRVIVGKALYEGRITLDEIQAFQSPHPTH